MNQPCNCSSSPPQFAVITPLCGAIANIVASKSLSCGHPCMICNGAQDRNFAMPGQPIAASSAIGQAPAFAPAPAPVAAPGAPGNGTPMISPRGQQFVSLASGSGNLEEGPAPQVVQRSRVQIQTRSGGTQSSAHNFDPANLDGMFIPGPRPQVQQQQLQQFEQQLQLQPPQILQQRQPQYTKEQTEEFKQALIGYLERQKLLLQQRLQAVHARQQQASTFFESDVSSIRHPYEERSSGLHNDARYMTVLAEPPSTTNPNVSSFRSRSASPSISRGRSNITYPPHVKPANARRRGQGNRSLPISVNYDSLMGQMGRAGANQRQYMGCSDLCRGGQESSPQAPELGEEEDGDPAVLESTQYEEIEQLPGGRIKRTVRTTSTTA